MALSGPTGVLYAFGRSDSSQLGIGRGDALKPGTHACPCFALRCLFFFVWGGGGEGFPPKPPL